MALALLWTDAISKTNAPLKIDATLKTDTLLNTFAPLRTNALLALFYCLFMGPQAESPRKTPSA
jgi:hypothetical protein